MTRKEADKLAQEINDTPGCEVTGNRVEGREWALDVQDTQTGIPFVVDSREAWEERRKAATFYDDTE